MTGQLTLFGDELPELPAGSRGRAAAAVRSAVVPESVAETAARLPRGVRLGTSSWSFPGWEGIVYAPREDGRPETESRLARGGLAAYGAHPLFRTVSLDRTFYAPISQEAFAAYAASVPEDFRFVVKAPAAITDPAVRKPGSGEVAADNPGFLDARLAVESFVGPATAGLGRKAGPLVFQFPPLGRRLLADPQKLAARFAAFLTLVPRGSVYAVEFRDPECATASFANAIRDAAAAGREVFVTINNKAEGSAPLSVQKLAEAVVAETCGP